MVIMVGNEGMRFTTTSMTNWGTPQELVTTRGKIVWSAVYKSYGNLTIDYQTISQPLRLPRQYFDEESGLHYNRHRYYDHTVHVTLVKTRLV